MAESFSVATRFPTRRRVIQACVACRTRKTRCDAAQPRCGFCSANDIDCVYRDAQQPRVDYNTQVLLERLDLLESRVLRGRTDAPLPTSAPMPVPASTPEVQTAVSHTANANHVFSWPVVQQMIREAEPSMANLDVNTTDQFFDLAEDQGIPLPDHSWALPVEDAVMTARYRQLLEVYFAEVNIFFPLLDGPRLGHILDIIMRYGAGGPEATLVQYALLLLVLSLASFVAAGHNFARLDMHKAVGEEEDDKFWSKAKLLLGSVSTEMSVLAAQCIMLASLYCGAKGRVRESFHWSHVASMKCEALARSYTRRHEPIPDSFSRLFWIAYIYEGDFISEISVPVPSGISRFEDLIPYPTFTSSNAVNDPLHRQQDEIVAFQITTNASIRRFLNRVNTALYDEQEQRRHQQDGSHDYPSWLLRISQDLWSHHDAVYRNLPEFLLVSSTGAAAISPRESPTARLEGMMPRGNNPWNILRLKGRYYAGQYIIHRPFIEYVVLHTKSFETHAMRESILNACKLCLNGCVGFIQVFDTEPANSISCLFAAGMVTFTMSTIIMISTIDPHLSRLLPDNPEKFIRMGITNLKRFNQSIPEFWWHLEILGKLDSVRRLRLSTDRS